MSVPASPEEARTRVIELLQAHHVAYCLLPHSEPVFTVAAAAEQRGVILEEMVKSILLRESGGDRYVMACGSISSAWLRPVWRASPAQEITPNL